jgi:ADP-heptose:LPS heptosyltransferase/glycosyltransferase involved in cell wall biosynthesis
MRILLHRRQGGLGDVICTWPAVDAFAARHRGDTVHVALPTEYAELTRTRFRATPDVRVLGWEPRRFGSRRRRLWESQYGRIIDLSGPTGDRAGMCSSERPGRRTVRSEREPNRIEFFLARCGFGTPTLRRPSYRVPDADREWARGWLLEHGIEPDGRPVVCLHLRSARAAKDWPLERYAALARRLIDRDERVVTLERTLRIDAPGIVGAQGLSLPRVAALLAACDALIGPDSGPMHLAAAVGTPAVALFGPTNPEVILKHYPTHRWIRRPRVADIEVHDVETALLDILTPPPPVAGVSPARDTGPRRVLFVSHTVFPETLGGAEISMHRLLAELDRRGFETSTRILRRHATVDLGELIRDADPGWVFTQLRVAPDVVAEAKRQNRRVALFVCSLAEHVCGQRRADLHVCSQTGRRAEPLTCSLRCLRRRRDVERQRAMFAAADVVSCNSQYVRRVIRRVFGRESIVQHPLIPEAEPGGLRRHRYLTIIRPSPGQGQRVFEGLVRRLPRREFLVIGGGPLDAPYDAVRFLPSTPRMGPVYRATRILLQPAVNTEAFGRTVAEAAAYGVPSVVSRQGGLPEALGPGGVSVRSFEDADAWVAAIDEVERGYGRFAQAAAKHAARFRSTDAIRRAMQQAEGQPGARDEPHAMSRAGPARAAA